MYFVYVCGLFWPVCSCFRRRGLPIRGFTQIADSRIFQLPSYRIVASSHYQEYLIRTKACFFLELYSYIVLLEVRKLWNRIIFCIKDFISFFLCVLFNDRTFWYLCGYEYLCSYVFLRTYHINGILVSSSSRCVTFLRMRDNDIRHDQNKTHFFVRITFSLLHACRVYTWNTSPFLTKKLTVTNAIRMHIDETSFQWAFNWNVFAMKHFRSILIYINFL